jgi:branched-chain amino acid transport system substrate-binding protein
MVGSCSHPRGGELVADGVIDMRYAVVLVVAVLLTAGWTPIDAFRPVTIGAVFPTAGGQGPGGIEEYRGVILAAEYVNRQDGLGGRPIRLRLVSASSYDAAPGAVEQLAHEGVTVIIGSHGSTISRPAAQTASRLGLVFWETGAVGEFGMGAAEGARVFRFAPTGAGLGRAAVAFVRDRLTPRMNDVRPLRFAITYVDDVYGKTVGLGAVEEVKRSGLPLVAVLPYDLARADYDDLARRIGQSGADVLVVAAYLQDGVALRRAIVRAKVPLVATIGTSSSYCHPAFGQILGEDALGLFASDKPDGDLLRTDSLTPEAAKALEWGRAVYQRRYGEVMLSPALSGFAGGLALFQHVLPRAGELSSDAVAKAALAVRLAPGGLPNGSGLSVIAPGHPDAGANAFATSVIWEWVQPKTRAVVWPPAFATHPIKFP